MADVKYGNPNNKKGEFYIRLHTVGETKGLELPMQFTKLTCDKGFLEVEYNDGEMEISMHNVDLSKTYFEVGK